MNKGLAIEFLLAYDMQSQMLCMPVVSEWAALLEAMEHEYRLSLVVLTCIHTGSVATWVTLPGYVKPPSLSFSAVKFR